LAIANGAAAGVIAGIATWIFLSCCASAHRSESKGRRNERINQPMSRRRTVVLTNSLDKLVSFSEIQSSFPGNPGESRGRPRIQEFLRLLTVRVAHTFFSELRRHHATNETKHQKQS